MIRPFTLSLLILLSGLFLHAREIRWQHGPSPYRAEFQCKKQNLPSDTGLLLTVPDCGTSRLQGEDVFCFDQRGTELFRQTIGQGIHNTVLILVRPESETSTILAYWGSHMSAPEAKIPYHTGLLAEMLEFTPSEQAENWSGLQKILKKAPSLGFFHLKDPVIMENPVNSRDAFIFRIRGFIPVYGNWRQTWFVAADDSGYFLLDDKLQIAREGRNYVYNSLRGEYKKDLTLSPGIHKAELIGVNFSGQSALAMGKLPGNPAPILITGKDFLSGAEARFIRISSRKNSGIPIFSYHHQSCISLNGFPLTETVYTLPGDQKDARWQFSDGLKCTGGSVARIHLSTDSLRLKLRCGRHRSEGTVEFPSRKPDQQLSPACLPHYDRYATMLAGQWKEGMRTEKYIPALVDFFLYYDFRKEAIPILQDILKEEELPRGRKRRLTVALARIASVHEKNIALQTYSELLPIRSRSENRAELVREALEFALFRLRDAKLADRWLRQYGLALHETPRRLLALKAELAFLENDKESFRNYLTRLQNLPPDKTETLLHSSVQGNAMEEKIRTYLEKDFLIKARTMMEDWENLCPTCRFDGSLALLRARLFFRMHWAEGALDILNAAILSDPLLPNLPDIEMLKAEIMEKSHMKDPARELYRKISSDYPNHPAAATALKRYQLMGK